ncbi:MAG: hypothetical protein ACI4XM_08900 [Candidatus Coprovivens sp.]
MVVSNQLKKQIVIEILALVFLIFVIIYAVFAIDKGSHNNISSKDGMVLVLDNSKFTKLEILSDGEGLNTLGTTYTITNNNSDNITYKVILTPSISDDEVLKNVRVSSDDIYIEDLVSLPKLDGGYVVSTNTLGAGYTKIHLFKYWYKLGTKEDNVGSDLTFSYSVVRE